MQYNSAPTTAQEIDPPPMLRPKIEIKQQQTNFVENTKANLKKKKEQIFTDSEGNPISKEQKERSAALKKTYKGVTKEERIMEAMELMKGGLADYSRKALLGNNLSGKPMIVSFEDLSKFGQAYANFDALGWKKKDRLYIYINQKHEDAPAPALAAVL